MKTEVISLVLNNDTLEIFELSNGSNEFILSFKNGDTVKYYLSGGNFYVYPKSTKTVYMSSVIWEFYCIMFEYLTDKIKNIILAVDDRLFIIPFVQFKKHMVVLDQNKGMEKTFHLQRTEMWQYLKDVKTSKNKLVTG